MRDSALSIDAVIDYIESHLTEKLTLSQLAHAVHYSVFHLHRLFIKTVGMTVHTYIRRRQLTEAAKLLVFTDKPILDIALTAGYESQQAFTSSFKAMYKKSPQKFRQNEAFYPLQLRFTLAQTADPLQTDIKTLCSQITHATPDDIGAWMDLARLVVDGFPCFYEEEYISVLNRYIAENRALILKRGELAMGCMLFSGAEGSIDFLGVHPQYRRQGIARAFLKKLTEYVPQSTDISMTTYREGDAADNGSRMFAKRMGFMESELMVEFGYPTQKFILNTERDHL